VELITIVCGDRLKKKPWRDVSQALDRRLIRMITELNEKDGASVQTDSVRLTVYDWHLLLGMLEHLLSFQSLGRFGEPPLEQVQRIYQELSAQLGARVVFTDEERAERARPEWFQRILKEDHHGT
jgi:hypothetical protein